MIWGREQIGEAVRRAFAALAGILALVCAGAAWAATATDTFDVTATVVASCIVSAADLPFGNYNPTANTPLDEEATISVTCTNGTGYTIALDKGKGAGASIASRRMEDVSNTHQLEYYLYKDNTYSALWGDGVGQTVAGTGSGAQQNLDVYGRIPIHQTSVAGGYDDTVTVTVTY